MISKQYKLRKKLRKKQPSACVRKKHCDTPPYEKHFKRFQPLFRNPPLRRETSVTYTESAESECDVDTAGPLHCVEDSGGKGKEQDPNNCVGALGVEDSEDSNISEGSSEEQEPNSCVGVEDSEDSDIGEGSSEEQDPNSCVEVLGVEDNEDSDIGEGSSEEQDPNSCVGALGVEDSGDSDIGEGSSEEQDPNSCVEVLGVENSILKNCIFN